MNTLKPSIGLIALIAPFLLETAAPAVEFPGPPPGKAVAKVESNKYRLENAVIGITWFASEGRLRLGDAVDRLSDKTIASDGELFTLVLRDGRTINSSEMKLLDRPRCEDLPGDPKSVRASLRCSGKCVSATLVSEDRNFQAHWRAILREGDNYVRQEYSLQAESEDLPLAEIKIGSWSTENAHTVGSVKGSPAVAGNLFFACEHPLADNLGEQNRVYCRLPCSAPIQVGRAMTCTSVVGVAPAGQLRRAFLYYVERERARPYQPFLHYNSWYDIRTPSFGGNEMDEARSLKVIDLLGRELVQKRSVQLDAFVFDDGWDDPKTLWDFHAGFPAGFTPLREAAARYGAGIGVWLSPFGGYAGPREERLKYGRTQGFEINSRGFALSGPKYYARFRDACRRMIEQYNVNYFKFDGIAAGLAYENSTPEDLADIGALLNLCNELKQLRPDVYLSLTTGTWASPYWLWCGDSIWRTGADMDFCGEGSRRQQWMNYRDANTQETVVRRGPLFPLNSLMNQGIAHAQLGSAGGLGDDLKEMTDDFRMFFGSGTQLQELYISPEMLTPPMWDVLAEAAVWSRNNADVLVDTHWIGGDAAKGEPYGYVSWSPRKGILCVRNPSREPKTLALKLAEAFELPPGAARRYSLKSPWKTEANLPPRQVDAEAELRLELQPFEVRILEAMP